MLQDSETQVEKAGNTDFEAQPYLDIAFFFLSSQLLKNEQ